LAKTAVTLRSTLHAMAFGAAIKLAARGGTLVVAAIATFPATRRRAKAFTITVEFAARRGTLAETAIAAFPATRRRTKAFTVTVEFAARRGTLAITTLATFGAAIFRSGKLRMAITAAWAFGIPSHFRARAGCPFRSGAFLRSDHAPQTDQAQRADTASKKHRRPDTAFLENSFAAHLAILLTVRRTVSGILGFDFGGLPQSGESSVLRLAQLYPPNITVPGTSTLQVRNLGRV
jgi:hypothetical protein